MIVHLFCWPVPPSSGWAAPEKKTASGGVINLRQIQIGSAIFIQNSKSGVSHSDPQDPMWLFGKWAVVSGYTSE